MHKRNAFTLIELLVVIGIIALLLALLTPAVSKARDRGLRVVCLSQMQQVAAGLVMYARDNDNRTPRGYTGKGWTNDTWRENILPHIGNEKKVLLCPVMNKKLLRGNSFANYGINAYIGENPSQIYLSQARHPAQTFAVSENNDGDWVAEPQNGPWSNPGWFYAHHNDGAMAAFLDGHGRWVSTEEAHQNNFYLFLLNKP
jgi:prepilin-type N-terminal cleavage/methylation domain-containing protein/prepilin-type processing-associated H-X9-DG protein